MALPDKPLTLKYDPDELTLDEICLFSGKESPTEFNPIIFRGFLRKHSNWTSGEIGGLTVADMRDGLGPQIKEAMEATAVPLESAPP